MFKMPKILGSLRLINVPLQFMVILSSCFSWFPYLYAFKNVTLISQAKIKQIRPHMVQTSQEYDRVIEECRKLFVNKTKDYGTAWRILRLPSLTDQIFIKAQRIRGLQENEVRKVDEGELPEFMGIINYAVMALIQLDRGIAEKPDLDAETAIGLYDQKVALTKALMENKNHDYGEAWRSMRVSSLTDLILQKLLRVKEIENNDGKTDVSEGVDANYQDMINYAVFALIHLEEKSS